MAIINPPCNAVSAIAELLVYITLELSKVAQVQDCLTTAIHGLQNWKPKTTRKEVKVKPSTCIATCMVYKPL